MIHQYSSGAPGRHSSRSAAHPAPYPYPATRAATAHQRLASTHASHHHPQQQQPSLGYATHQTAAYLGQQQVELRQRVAAGTIGGGFALGELPAAVQPLHPQQQQQQQQQQLSFDRSTAVKTAPVWSTDSSPFSEALSDDFADGGHPSGDFGDESFEDGLIKDQYRGRAWSSGQQATARRSSFNAASAVAVGYPVYQQQPQQQPGHLDRLFNGLQLPPLVGLTGHGHQQQQQQQAFYGHQQQQQMPPPLQQQQQAYAPVSPAPAPTVAEPTAPLSALPLAPFIADAIWGLLQQAPAASAVGHKSQQQQQQPVQIHGGQYDDDRWYPFVPLLPSSRLAPCVRPAY